MRPPHRSFGGTTLSLAPITRQGELPAYPMVIIVGEVIALLAMVTFAFAVLDFLRKRN